MAPTHFVVPSYCPSMLWRGAPVGSPALARNLLLADCRTREGTEVGGGSCLVQLKSAGVGVRLDMAIFDSEPFTNEAGDSVRSLLIRPLYSGPSLDRALVEREEIPVVAFWRTYGFEWSPRSVLAAERFGVGIGGSMFATLIPLTGPP